MKIGILTFHYAHNYGAVLQAYALKKYISKFGHEVDIINYRNKTVAKRYSTHLKSGIPFKNFKHKWAIKQEINFLKNRKYAKAEWIEQCRNFNSFISLYLSSEKEVKNYSEFNCSYDIIVVGSDQIWTSQLTNGLDKYYLLDFPFNGKKVSYGASIACGYIPDRELEYFQKCLSDFDYISTREQSLSDSIIKNFSLSSETVLDPTLLLDKNDYITLAQKSKLHQDGEAYLFAYFVTEDSAMHEFANKIAKQLDIKLIELHYYMQKGFDSTYQHANYGPNEFLDAILNADLIITNSFHGTVFSIIFKKNFYAFYLQNARIQNLLNAFDLVDRNINSNYSCNIDIYSKINYDCVTEKLIKYRSKSIGFLKNICNN